MPINASIEFEKAKAKFDLAETPSEKLAALQEMRSTAPAHKGAEKLRAEITLKISRIKKDMEKQKQQDKKAAAGHSINIRKEGAGQIVILGMPNTGKSHLLNKISNVQVEEAPYPFTTSKPEIGTMDYKGAKVQIIEVPAIIKESSKGKANGTKLLGLARNADAIIITYKKETEKEIVVNELKNVGIIVNRKKPKIEIKISTYKNITISGKQHLKMSEKELESILKSFGIHHASVLLEEETTIEKLAEVLDTGLEYKNCLFVKNDAQLDIDEIKKQSFFLLEKILIYTKRPGKEPDFTDPLAVDKKSTIKSVAEQIHKDLAKKLKFVKVWGSTKFPGQRVSKSYSLQNEDIIELN
ncbi:MAG: hypothetical protein COV47_05565 [Candidatus Diapherotrites archaeon CG11_big_fil_rev_8_21_14_0_20_37_9]|nr:MAG: hypothetical protein COV47_05565 [Candidatus Diapherotrites archaeon CG11_big_fil_rev_8_21_14_0_20_37_9]